MYDDVTEKMVSVQVSYDIQVQTHIVHVDECTRISIHSHYTVTGNGGLGWSRVENLNIHPRSHSSDIAAYIE